MKFNINKYMGNYAMHCKTEEEAKIFCRYLDSVGRDVKLPIKFVHEILPDSCYKWSFKNIYGCDDSFYEESLISLSL